MKKFIVLFIALLALYSSGQEATAKDISNQDYPIGKPGLKLIYRAADTKLPASVVRTLEITAGAVEENQGKPVQWFYLNAVKENKEAFNIWMLASRYPSESVGKARKDIIRYIITDSESQPLEFINKTNGKAVLPNTGAWKYLIPRPETGKNPVKYIKNKVMYLGHEYVLQSKKSSEITNFTTETHVISLTPDLLIGVPHNKKVKDETRRYDESDYEYVELTEENYSEMIENGINVLNVNREQANWVQNKNIYYWGIGGKDIMYPEDLYRSNYIGPSLFFDEPMVHARDYALKPRFKEDPALRKTITPQKFFEEFKNEYHKAKYEGSPVQLLRGLAKREDVDLGDMNFLQQNVYSWETMVSSAIYQLSEGDISTPSAIVFEPPGRLGSRRVIPELNMCFDCQIPADDPKNMIGIVKGFLRGAARVTGKDWGISIYGQVDRSEAYWYMTHAYDHGATQFHFWDNYQLAAVPYHEYLSLSKNLREHAKDFPRHDLDKLKSDAEVAILLPVGYNLGHVKMGIGNFSGLPELNMERYNDYGIKYREVMNNFYTEIERCIRLGVEYDIFWKLDNLELNGYREVIDIREDGKVEVSGEDYIKVLNSARVPERPEGEPPGIEVEVFREDTKAGNLFRARAVVTEGSAPVYYTQGADKNGIYRNTYVLWELYGPEEEDYTDFWNERWNVYVSEEDNSASVEINFKIDKPGKYRLRVSAADLAGRSQVVWNEIDLTE